MKDGDLKALEDFERKMGRPRFFDQEGAFSLFSARRALILTLAGPFVFYWLWQRATDKHREWDWSGSDEWFLLLIVASYGVFITRAFFRWIQWRKRVAEWKKRHTSRQNGK